MKKKKSKTAGRTPGIQYKAYENRQEPGAEPFVHTDGRSETTSESGEPFGKEQTQQALNEVSSEPPHETSENVRTRADDYVAGAPQFDDLTTQCLAYRGGSDTLTLDASIENVAKAVAFVSERARNAPLTPKAVFNLEIAVDEIVCNIAKYAYEGGEGVFTVRTECDESSMTVTVTDYGIPYNPLQKEDPDITLPAEARGIGGYGIFLAKKLTDAISYEYKNQTNTLRFRKNFDL